MNRLLTAVATWEWLLLLILALVLAIPSSSNPLFLLLIPLLLLARRLSLGYFFPATPFNVILFALATAIILSLTAIFDFALSLPKLAGIIVGLALYFAVVVYSRQRTNGAWLVALVTVLAGTGMAVFGLFYGAWQPPFAWIGTANEVLPSQLASMPGAIDGEVNLNEMAGVLAWIIPLLLSLLLAAARRQGTRSTVLAVILAVIFAFNCFLLIASNSRGGQLSVALALLFMMLLRLPQQRRLLPAGLAAGAIVIFGLWLVQLPPFSAAQQQELGVQARQEIWAIGLSALKEFPLTGTSMNGFRELVGTYYGVDLLSPTRDVGHAHNQLLQAGLDLGLLGLVAYLAIWMLATALLWEGIRPTAIQTDTWQLLRLGLAGALMAGWFFGLLDAIALGARPGFIWWMLLALVVAATVDRRTFAMSEPANSHQVRADLD